VHTECQISEEITPNTTKLGTFEKLSEKGGKSTKNVAIIGNYIVLAYP